MRNTISNTNYRVNRKDRELFLSNTNQSNLPQRNIRVHWSKYDPLFKRIQLWRQYTEQPLDSTVPNKNDTQQIYHYLLGTDNNNIEHLTTINNIDIIQEKTNPDQYIVVLDNGYKSTIIYLSKEKSIDEDRNITILDIENELMMNIYNNNKRTLSLSNVLKNQYSDVILGFPPNQENTKLEKSICIWNYLSINKDAILEYSQPCTYKLEKFQMLSPFELYYIKRNYINGEGKYRCKIAKVDTSQITNSNQKSIECYESLSVFFQDNKDSPNIVESYLNHTIAELQSIMTTLLPIRIRSLNYILEDEKTRPRTNSNSEYYNNLVSRANASAAWRKLINSITVGLRDYLKNNNSHKNAMFIKNELSKKIKCNQDDFNNSEIQNSSNPIINDQNSGDDSENPHVKDDSSINKNKEVNLEKNETVSDFSIGSLDNYDKLKVEKQSKLETNPIKKIYSSYIINNNDYNIDCRQHYCAICFRSNVSSLNPIYECIRCWVCAHKYCYSILFTKGVEDNESFEFICKRCEFEKKVFGAQWNNNFIQGSVICVICGQYGGAFKRTLQQGEWVHIFCVLWLIDNINCQDIEHLDNWDLSSLSLRDSNNIESNQCSICKISWGFYVKCSHQGCQIWYHPMCSWLSGNFVQVNVNDRKYIMWKGKINCEFPTINISSYCLKHTPDQNKLR